MFQAVNVLPESVRENHSFFYHSPFLCFAKTYKKKALIYFIMYVFSFTLIETESEINIPT